MRKEFVVSEQAAKCGNSAYQDYRGDAFKTFYFHSGLILIQLIKESIISA
jgi:hypothetical protein